ncbi:BirA family biotin operon repressor/biotin-[acetyl-CoA-carboxylase] ligase [Sporomusaceae bacterium BoRhaA]|uniref:biotin--[acetyl-CoA-carboxylase] ligase n=1 Tax=Pelorhabdus rhamnosifermentans TaxID=2772457 RepID=UPI001C061201|nr:biotin--[acetyl-CoA-carboxylase] ligase [Pelorhabdus rhamnosifermentans]MBU2700665.1 BirA family biotin operon repressor/biotin-[acetyl-CoA-carboxylase] ligase [Pelorhabdus rhamnosifermentans]
MRNAILEMLRNHRDEYLSGEDISRRLAVSRTAVWKHIQALKQAGYEIESHTRRGYKLLMVPDRLRPEEIIPHFSTQWLGKKIVYFDDVSSTNNEARNEAQRGAPEGTIVIAESQNNGKGRLARGWYSPQYQGIWLSVVLRPKFRPADAPKCSLLAAVALERAIFRQTGIHCGIKWPNDLLYDNKKLIGILTEMSAEFDAINYIVIGMGINVNTFADDLPQELQTIATSLAMITGEKVNRKVLLGKILEELEHSYDKVCSEGFGPLLDEWRRKSITLGKIVDVFGMDEQFSGKAVDIDADGALLIERETGIERVLAGDVSIRMVKR